MSKLMNLLKRNPGMTAGGIIFLIALVALIGWIVNRGGKGQVGPGAAAVTTSDIVKPTIQFQTTEKILHPNKQGVETYMIEYATGTSSAKFVDIVINWSNGAGFKENNIKSLLFTRKSGDSVIDTIDTKNLTNREMYVRNFETGLSVIFPGSTDLDNYVGSDGGIPLNIMIETVDADGNKGTLANKDEKINQSDLDTTLTISSLTTLQASPVLSGSFTPTKTSRGRGTRYKLLFADDSTVIPELSDVVFKVNTDGWIEFYNSDGEQVNITNAADTTQTYEFVKFGEGDKYLVKGRFNNTGDGGYLIYDKKIDGSVTGWSFTGATLADGINNILSDADIYKKAFVKIEEFDSISQGTTPAADVVPDVACLSTYTGDDCVGYDSGYGPEHKGKWRLEGAKTKEACDARRGHMTCGGFETIFIDDFKPNACYSTYTGDDCVGYDSGYGPEHKGKWRLEGAKTKEACDARRGHMTCGGFKTVFIGDV